jgi:AcrR family transcriptional regulator
MKKGDTSLTREAILLAASRVVVEAGISGMTLEAVAWEAGVSKGGLLYHFPSKEALISGMIERLIEGFAGLLEQELEREKGSGSGGWLPAYATATFAEDRRHLEIGAALLAAVAENPALVDPLHRGFEDWQWRAERNGIDPAVGTLVRLAADGLFFAEMFGFAPPEGRLRERVLEALLFYLLALALKQQVPLEIAYAIWSGLGTVGAVAAGILLWHESLNLAGVVGIVLIIAGVTALNLFSGTFAH